MSSCEDSAGRVFVTLGNHLSSSEGCLAKKLPPDSGQNDAQMSTSEDCLAVSLLVESDWNQGQMSNFQGCLANKLPPSFGQNYGRMSSSEDCWEALFCASSDWNIGQMSSFEGYLAVSLLAGSGLKRLPNAKVSRLPGRVIPSKLWLKRSPSVKLRRLLGRDTPSRLWLKRCPNIKFCRLPGSITESRLWLKYFPNVKLWSLLPDPMLPMASIVPSRLSLKLSLKVKSSRLWGSFSKSSLRLSPAIRVSPSSASPWTGNPRIEHHAA